MIIQPTVPPLAQTTVLSARRPVVAVALVSLLLSGAISPSAAAKQSSSLPQALSTSSTPVETLTPVLRLITSGQEHVDSLGRTWQPDALYADGGNTWRSTAQISGTTDPALFQSERWGVRGYRLPVPAPGTYRVTLNEAELYWDGSEPGQRVFDVTAEGRTVAEAVDIASAVGVRAAHRVVVEAEVSDGVLDLGFVTRVDQPKVASLMVEKVDLVVAEPLSPPRGWVTTPDQLRRVAPLSDQEVWEDGVSGQVDVAVDRSARGQTIDGFGAALTESSAYLIMSLPPERREKVMRSLFDPVSGAGIDMVRVPLGASDFALSHYSYDDMPKGRTDPQLKRLSIARDDAYIVPLLQQALAINPALRVMGTPWSAPGWMKTSKSLIGGELVPANEEVYARYLTRVVQEYRDRGIPMTFLTLQNEPGYTPADYPGMRLTADQAKRLVGHLAPQLRAAGLADVQLIGHDHNWNNTAYPLKLLADPATRADLAGTAWHCYGGAPEAQLTVHDAYPDKGIWFTECSGGAWSSDFGTNLGWNASTLAIDTVRARARSVLLWNLALDPTGGPHTGGCGNCRGVLTIDPVNRTVKRNVEYDVLALATKTVSPGATRIGSTTDVHGIRTVAYENLDGSASMTAYNFWSIEQTVTVRDGGRAVTVVIPAGSVVHLNW